MSRFAQSPSVRLGGTVLDLIEARAAEHRERVAVGAPGRPPLSYAALLDVVKRAGEALASAGCGPADRIAIVMPHGPELATASLSLMATATCVPLNPEYTEGELRRLMERLGVSLVVVSADQRAARDAASSLRLPALEIGAEPGGPAGAFALDGRSAPGGPSARGISDARNPHDVALVLHTSGSTADPKIVPLTHANLLASAANVAGSLQLGPDDVALSSLPLFHIGGLLDLLLAPLSVGGGVVVASGMGGADFFAHLPRARPTWYQGVPTMLQDILRVAQRAAAEGRGLPEHRLRFVRSVSAPLPPEMLRAFERALGVPVIEMYGMTETAGVITSNPLPPRERRAGSVGVPAGPEVVVVDAAGNPAAPGVRGEVLVRGPSVTTGYEQDGRVRAFTDGWLRTGDEGWLDADGYLYLSGRIKEIINRGGEKISPREIDEVALTCPGVRDAAAFGVPHETLGEEVAIAVVPSEGVAVDEHELLALCAARLARFKVPRRVFFVDALPRTPGGKLQRVRLPEWCLGAAGDDPPTEADGRPANERQELLLACWRDVLETTDVGVHDDFFDAGGDSLRAVEVAVRMSERLGLEVPVSALYDHPTVAALEERLDALDLAPGAAAEGDSDAERRMLEEVRDLVATWKGARPSPGSLLVGRNTLGSRPPLFWGAQGYGELCEVADRLGADQPVFGMRSLYETTSKSPENTTALARRYRDEIERLRPDGPILLGGYCAGGRIALEIARGLREAGREVATLCLVEHFSPEPYDGRVAFFFAAESGWHPFKTASPAWAPHYMGPVRLYPSRQGHEEIPRDELIMAALRRELDEALEGRCAGSPSAGPAPRAATPSGPAPSSERAAADRGAARPIGPPRVLVSRATRAMHVPLVNEGAAAWPAGTLVYARWARPGSERIIFDGWSRLEHPVEPGARVPVALDVRAPLAPGPWTLAVEVVPGGAWRAGGELTARRHLVLVVPGRAVWSYLRSRLPRPAGWAPPSRSTA